MVTLPFVSKDYNRNTRTLKVISLSLSIIVHYKQAPGYLWIMAKQPIHDIIDNGRHHIRWLNIHHKHTPYNNGREWLRHDCLLLFFFGLFAKCILTYFISQFTWDIWEKCIFMLCQFSAAVIWPMVQLQPWPRWDSMDS